MNRLRKKLVARLLRARPSTSRRPPARRAALSSWTEAEPGASVQVMEQALLSHWLSDLFGFHLVQVGACGPADWLADSRIQTRTIVTPNPPATDSGGADAGHAYLVAGHASALPIASGSVDVVVMPHVLEYEQDPYAALREAYRVLIPEGHLIITGFSPFSTLGAAIGWEHRLFSGRLASQMGSDNGEPGEPNFAGDARQVELRLIRAARARDWLSVLGLELSRWEALFLRPPLRSKRLLARLAWIERIGAAVPWLNRRGAGVYALHARKRVAGMTPLRPLARYRTRLVPSRLAGASAGMAPATSAGALRSRPRLVMVAGRALRDSH